MEEHLTNGTPLLARTADATKIFGLSVSTLQRLRVQYPDFRALTIKTGREVLYDVPKCYKWFGTWEGSELSIQS